MNRAEARVFIATSLDGFIARSDGNLDWLMQAQATAPAGEDFGYAKFMVGIEALVMGRKTFETLLGFDPWPYPGRTVHVMSRSRAVRLPEALRPMVRETSQSPADLLRQLAQTGARRVYLDGGELIQSYSSQAMPRSPVHSLWRPRPGLACADFCSHLAPRLSVGARRIAHPSVPAVLARDEFSLRGRQVWLARCARARRTCRHPCGAACANRCCRREMTNARR